MRVPFIAEYLGEDAARAILKHAEDVASSVANVDAQDAAVEPSPVPPRGWERVKRLAEVGVRPALGLGAGAAIGAGGAALLGKGYEAATGHRVPMGFLVPAGVALGTGSALANHYVMSKLLPKDLQRADQGITEPE